MKRIVYALLATVSGVVLLFSYRTSLQGANPTDAAAAAPITGGSSAAPTGAGTPTSKATPTPTPTPSTPSSSGSSSNAGSNSSSNSNTNTNTAKGSGLTDGTYSGSSVSTRYGAVQVQITVAGGAISNVTMLAYPNGDRRDQQINQQALPILISETISAQSADVQLVSGATYTSEGYTQSLQSAIDRARS